MLYTSNYFNPPNTSISRTSIPSYIHSAHFHSSTLLLSPLPFPLFLQPSPPFPSHFHSPPTSIPLTIPFPTHFHSADFGWVDSTFPAHSLTTQISPFLDYSMYVTSIKIIYIYILHICIDISILYIYILQRSHKQECFSFSIFASHTRVSFDFQLQWCPTMKVGSAYKSSSTVTFESVEQINCRNNNWR